MKIINQSSTLEYVTPDALKVIEMAGRNCYKSENCITDESAEAFVRMIMAPDKAHLSVLEHATARFRFITDRGVTHELVRHRLASFSQESTRYCNYGKDKFGNEITVILPVRYYDNMGEALPYENWYYGLQNCERRYFEALRLGEKPQEARDLLPNSLKTEIVMTANFREWLTIFKQRTSQAAHPQMRDLMSMALNQIRGEIKVVFDEII